MSAAPARGVRETGLGALFCEQGFPPGGGCLWRRAGMGIAGPHPGGAPARRRKRCPTGAGAPTPRGGGGVWPKVTRPIASKRSSVRLRFSLTHWHSRDTGSLRRVLRMLFSACSARAALRVPLLRRRLLSTRTESDAFGPIEVQPGLPLPLRVHHRHCLAITHAGFSPPF